MDSISDKKRKKDIYKVTIVGAIVNILLIVFKFVAGTLGRSSAMIADAVHSLSDLVTDIAILIFVRIANKPIDKSYDYGYGKYETLATLLIGIVLLLVGLGVAWNSLHVILYVVKGNTLASPGIIALIAAIVSIVSKEILYRYTIACGRRLKSDATIANAWHHRSDALSSIATAVGIGGAILLGEKWRVLDPLAAFLVSIFIIRVAIQLIKPSLDELMEKSLSEEIEDEIVKTVNTFDRVSQMHHLCTRKIGNNYAIEFHIRMNGNTSLSEAHENITQIENKLKELYGDQTHIIIHVEPLHK